MSLSDIRDKIDTALAGISGIEHYATIPSVVNPPCAMAGLTPANPVTYDFSAQNGSVVYHFYIEMLVNKGATLEQAQDDLDPYLQSAGSTSIKATIEAVDWASTADCCRITGISNYGPAVYGGTEYLGARILLDVWRSS